MPQDHKAFTKKEGPPSKSSSCSSPLKPQHSCSPCKPITFTVENFPGDVATKEECGLPWGLVVSPLASLKPEEVRHYRRKNRPLKLSDVPRCCSCFGYINGHCPVRARYWECGLCGAANVMEKENFLYRVYDSDLETLSVAEPAGCVYECEIPLSWRGGTAEGCKGSRLDSHEPLSDRPPFFLFLVQVPSIPSMSTPTITSILEQSLGAVPSGARVAIWAFDHGTLATFDLRSPGRPQVHLFHTSSKDSLPNLSQWDEWGDECDAGSVVDLILDTLHADSILCPMPDDQTARQTLSHDASERVVKLLPTLFPHSGPKSQSSNGADLLEALAVVGGLVAQAGESTIGARVTAIVSSVGDWGDGALTKRYRELGRWLGGVGVGVGVCGIGTELQLTQLTEMVGLTSGEMWHIPATRDGQRGAHDMTTITRVAQWGGGDTSRSFDGILRLRTSTSIGLDDAGGMYGLGVSHPRLSNIRVLASCHPEQSLAMDFKFCNVSGLGEQHSFRQHPLVQMVYAYTTMSRPHGEWVVSRYLRVVTVRATKVSYQPCLVQSSADSASIFFLLFHKIMAGGLGEDTYSIREGFIEWLSQAMNAHHRQSGGLSDGGYDALGQLRYHIYRLSLFCCRLGIRGKTDGKDDGASSSLVSALSLCPMALERWVCPHVFYLNKDSTTLSSWHPLPPTLQLVGGMGLPSAHAYLIEGYDRLVLYYPKQASGLHSDKGEVRAWVNRRKGMLRRVEEVVVEYEAGDGKEHEWEDMLVEDRGDDFRGFCQEVGKRVHPIGGD